MENSKWTYFKADAWECDSKFLRIVLYKQHGFFAEQYCKAAKPDFDFPAEPEKELLYSREKWNKVEAFKEGEKEKNKLKRMPVPKPNR